AGQKILAKPTPERLMASIHTATYGLPSVIHIHGKVHTFDALCQGYIFHNQIFYRAVTTDGFISASFKSHKLSASGRKERGQRFLKKGRQPLRRATDIAYRQMGQQCLIDQRDHYLLPKRAQLLVRPQRNKIQYVTSHGSYSFGNGCGLQPRIGIDEKQYPTI